MKLTIRKLSPPKSLPTELRLFGVTARIGKVARYTECLRCQPVEWEYRSPRGPRTRRSELHVWGGPVRRGRWSARIAINGPAFQADGPTPAAAIVNLRTVVAAFCVTLSGKIRRDFRELDKSATS